MRAVSGPLSGKVALVTGATRGAGRGTAVSLGEAGATVYCTGRTTGDRRSEYDRPETIEETAEPVTTVILAFLAFGESLSPVQLGGGALVLGAVLVLSASTTRPAKASVQ